MAIKKKVVEKTNTLFIAIGAANYGGETFGYGKTKQDAIYCFQDRDGGIVQKFVEITYPKVNIDEVKAPVTKVVIK